MQPQGICPSNPFFERFFSFTNKLQNKLFHKEENLSLSFVCCIKTSLGNWLVGSKYRSSTVEQIILIYRRAVLFIISFVIVLSLNPSFLQLSTIIKSNFYQQKTLPWPTSMECCVAWVGCPAWRYWIQPWWPPSLWPPPTGWYSAPTLCSQEQLSPNRLRSSSSQELKFVKYTFTKIFFRVH